MMMRAALLLLLLTSGAQAQELTGTLAKIRDAGRIGLGIRDRSLPFGYLDGDRPVGYGIDVCLRVVAAIEQALHLPKLTVDMRPVQSAPYAIMLRQGDAPFKAAVDQATGALFRSDEGPALYRHWFQSVLPGRGINLAMPMSPGLRRAFERPTDSPDPARYSN